MNRILLTTLGGAVSIIVLLIGAWAQGVSAQTSALEHRISVLEQHYVHIETKLNDIKDGLAGLSYVVEEGSATPLHRLHRKQGAPTENVR